MAQNLHLFLPVNGGQARLVKDLNPKLDEGSQTLEISGLPAEVTDASMDMVERGNTPLKSVSFDGASMKGHTARISVTAEKAGKASLAFHCDFPGQASVRHRIALDADGGAEWMSKVTVENHGDRPISKAQLIVTAGDTQNQGYDYGYESVGRRAMAAPARTEVRAASAGVYELVLPQPISVDAKDPKTGRVGSKTVNLFAEEFKIKDVGKALTLTTHNGIYYGPDARELSAGPVNTSYTIANTEENGLGRVFPQGAMEIKLASGTLLSNENLANTSVGEDIKLDGGRAFDLDTFRRQTGFEDVGQPRRLQGRREKIVGTRATQEITVKNRGKSDETFGIAEQLPQPIEGHEEIKVSNVTVNGQAVAADAFAVNAENGTLEISGIAVPANGEVKVSFQVEYGRIVY